MSKKIPAKVQIILDETRKELQKIYRDRLKDIILFGSYARGDFLEDSDIDIILLIENAKDIFAEREKYFPIVSRISLEYDKIVSIIPFDSREFLEKRTPLILNVNKEGIRI
jgi:uncharacterized protein